jgi:hypothetical protein
MGVCGRLMGLKASARARFVVQRPRNCITWDEGEKSSEEKTRRHTFDDLMQVKHEKEDQEKVLDVVAAGKPVPDGGDESDDDG